LLLENTAFVCLSVAVLKKCRWNVLIKQLNQEENAVNNVRGEELHMRSTVLFGFISSPVSYRRKVNTKHKRSLLKIDVTLRFSQLEYDAV
jgi:hypothetical protein